MADDALNQSELGFLKDQLLLVPALGTALAIAYDVGYFNGVDISFFTLFSISEHIVFALQALPFGIVSAILFGVLTSTTLETTVGAAADRVPSKLYPIGWIGGTIIMIVLFWSGGWNFAMGILFGISAGAYFRWMKITQPSKTVKLVAVSIFVFTFAFIMGFTQSRSYLKDGDGSHQIVTEGETLTTKIIRSGDRVMLFLDVKANQLGFLRWDSIKKVTANR